MIFTETELPGAFIIDLERLCDERGFFARTWCRHEFEEHGLNSDLTQCSISFNEKKGTLRGMHWQEAPYEEAKLVRCTRGAIFDVVLDMRPTSVTFKKWFAVELSSQNRKMLYIPAICAHGFQTLEDESEVLYQIAGDYCSAAARGVRFDEAEFGIKWPLEVAVIAAQDRSFDLLENNGCA